MSPLMRCTAAGLVLGFCLPTFADTHAKDLIDGRLSLLAKSSSSKEAPISASYRVDGTTANVEYLIKLTGGENLDFTLSFDAYGSAPSGWDVNSFSVSYGIVADFDPTRIVYSRPQATIDANSTWTNASSPDGNVFRDTFAEGLHRANFSFHLTDVKLGYGRFPDGDIDGALLVIVGVSLVPEPATLTMFGMGCASFAALLLMKRHRRKPASARV